MPRFPVAVPLSVTLSPTAVADGTSAAETLRQAQGLAQVSGPAWTAKDGSPAGADVLAMGSALARTRQNTLASVDEAFLDTTTYLLSAWEEMLGLAVSPGLPVDVRRARLISHWRTLRGGTPQALLAAVNAVLVAPDTAQVVENTVADCAAYPPGVFLFAVVVPSVSPSFRYLSDDGWVARLRATLDGQKPAHTGYNITNRVGFRCDDPDSLTDLTVIAT